MALAALLDVWLLLKARSSQSGMACLGLYGLCFMITTLIVGAMSTKRRLTDMATRTPASASHLVRILRSLQSAAVFSWMFFRLVLFALMLLPAFLNVGWWYYWSPNIRRSIPYGDKKFRQSLDVYIPPREKVSNDKQKSSSQTDAQTPARSKFPVLVFVGGGAWVVGHRMFCALLGKIFMSRGILFIAPDYRQFPQVRVNDMLKDIDASIQFVFENCEDFGGDADQIYIAGQSAGAHITSTLILEHARSEYKEQCQGVENHKQISMALDAIPESEEDASEENELIAPCSKSLSGARELVCQKWKSSCVAGYIGISGPYHLPALRQHLFQRGIEQLSFLTHIIGGAGTSMLKDSERNAALSQHSPAIRLRSDTFKEMGRRTFIEKVIPPMHLIHGDADNVVPKQSTKSFATSLKMAGIKDITVKYLKGASHTDPIIEDLLFDESDGSEAGAITEILALIHKQRVLRAIAATASPKKNRLNPKTRARKRKMRTPSMISDGFGFVSDERGRATSCVPRLLVSAARFVNPF